MEADTHIPLYWAHLSCFWWLVLEWGLILQTIGIYWNSLKACYDLSVRRDRMTWLIKLNCSKRMRIVFIYSSRYKFALLFQKIKNISKIDQVSIFFNLNNSAFYSQQTKAAESSLLSCQKKVMKSSFYQQKYILWWFCGKLFWVLIKIPTIF